MSIGEQSALLRNIRNRGICLGKKPYRFCNLRKWKDFNKNSLPYIKWVLHLSCVVHGPIYDRFMGCTVNGFLSIYKIAQARNLRASASNRHCCRNIRNIRICMGKKPYCFCNLWKWKDFNKRELSLHKMRATSLLCGPRADLRPFYGLYCKRFSLSMQGLPRGGDTPANFG